MLVVRPIQLLVSLVDFLSWVSFEVGNGRYSGCIK